MEGENAGLTLWDLRSDTDDLQSAEIQVKWECDRDDAGVGQAGPPPMAGDRSLGDRISTVTTEKEHTDNRLHENQSSWSLSVNRFKEYYESFDESEIDNDGWFVDEPRQDKTKSHKDTGQDTLACTSTTTIYTSNRKRPFSDMNSEGSGKIINLADFRREGSNGDHGQWISYQINKERKNKIVATTSSEEPCFRNSNARDSRFSSKSIGQMGSMSLPVCPQELEREGSHGKNKNRNIQKSSDVNDELPDVVPNQSQRKLKDILDQAVKMADEATVAQTGNSPSGYVLKSYMYSKANEMVGNEGRGDQVDKKQSKSSDGKPKPRPSERARILRRMQPKATPPDDRTFLALIPVMPPPANPSAKIVGSTVSEDEKSKTDDVKIDENKRVTRSQVKNILPKPSQAELQEAIAQGEPVPNPLSSTLFRRIAPKPPGPVTPKPQDPSLPKSQTPPTMFVPIFELVPMDAPTSNTEKPTCSAGKLPVPRPKTSSARRKQDPLSGQTRGARWRQEESEMLVEESREAEKEEQDVVDLISDEEEEEIGEGWEVLNVEFKTEDEGDDGDTSW